MNTNTFKPTFLYIKEHNQTGLKYFGKTTRSDPEEYSGSGQRWLRHLRKHGFDISTVWYCLFTEPEDLVEFATTFSKTHNIVEDRKWANLILEDGLTGHPKGVPSRAKGCKVPPRSQQWRDRQSLAQRGRKNPEPTDETRRKLSEGSKGKLWWNNGVSRTKSVHCPGPGWVLGRDFK